MPTGPFKDVMTSPDELRALVGEPSERAVKKELAALDGYARAFIAHGYVDVTYAVPIDPGKFEQVVSIARDSERFAVITDDPSVSGGLNAAAARAGVTIDVLLDVDCGYHRTGVDPRAPEAVGIPRQIVRPTMVWLQRMSCGEVRRESSTCDERCSVRRNGNPICAINVTSTEVRRIGKDGIDHQRQTPVVIAKPEPNAAVVQYKVIR